MRAEREGDSESLFQPHGNRIALSGEDYSRRAAERPQQDGAAAENNPGQHPQVNDLYDFALRDTSGGVRLFWQTKEDRKNWRESRGGAYLLRTNLQAETAEELCPCTCS